MEIKFDVYFRKTLGTLFKSNEADLDGVEASVNIDLNLVEKMSANYKVGDKTYTDSVAIKDNHTISIPFKSDVTKVGLNEFEIVAYMKNGDIKASQTYVYNIEKGIGEGTQILEHMHSNLSILESITQDKVFEWDNKANADHTHNEYLTEMPPHTHNTSEILGIEDLKTDLSNYYTKSEINNIIGDINEILDMINGEVI